MSAPMTHDPLVVNTKDGAVWLRRAVTQDGRGLYAVDGSCRCPEYLMATLAELAEHGIAGHADVLPVPVGPEPLEDRERVELLTAFKRALAPFCGDPMAAAAAVAAARDAEVEWLLADAQRLQDRVTELEHTVQQMCDALNGHDCPPPGETPFQLVTRVSIAWSEAERQVAELEDELGREWHEVNRVGQALRYRKDAYDRVLKQARDYYDRLEAVQHVCDEADRKGVTSGGMFTVVAVRGAASGKAAPQAGVSADRLTRMLAPTQALREDEAGASSFGERADQEADPGRRAAWRMLAEVEDPHDSPLHHDYQVPRDLPETGGAK